MSTFKNSATIRFEDSTWIWGVALFIGYLSAVFLPENFLGMPEANLLVLRGTFLFGLLYFMVTAINTFLMQMLEKVFNYETDRHESLNYVIYLIGIVIFIWLYMISVGLFSIRLNF